VNQFNVECLAINTGHFWGSFCKSMGLSEDEADQLYVNKMGGCGPHEINSSECRRFIRLVCVTMIEELDKFDGGRN
jgi:hypothetical protein